MEEKFLSCKCITYGRVKMLEEAIQSFLQQDYPADKCELVIVNDYPLQILEYNHPQIKIFNLHKTFQFSRDIINNKITIQLSKISICFSKKIYE